VSSIRCRNLLQQNEITQRCVSRPAKNRLGRTFARSLCVPSDRSFFKFFGEELWQTFILASHMVLLSEKRLCLFGVPGIRAEERTTNKRNKIEMI
jgi:hypothetical protein